MVKGILSLLFLVHSFVSGAQHSTAQYMVSYGQAWGFLKYFHPEPGNLKWDEILIADYPVLSNCKSDSAFNELIGRLIETCGEYNGSMRDISDSLMFEESFEWMNDGVFNTTHQGYLKELRMHKPHFENNYIQGTLVGNPKITEEDDYGDFSRNPAIQYLALTRYWNIINYYCPNRNLITENWNTVYLNYVPIFESIETYEDYYFAVRRLTAEIRDGHGFIRTTNDPMANYRYAPFYAVSVKEGIFITLVWNDSLKPSKLQVMDQLMEIDGIPVVEKMREVGSYVSTSNDYYLSKATHFLRITNADTMIVKIKRGDQLITDTLVTIDKETLQQRYKPVKYAEPKPDGFFTDSISDRRYGYVNMGVLKRSDLGWKFKRKLRKVDHLIIDSRNYPNWTIIKLCGMLIEGKTTFAKFIKMNFDYPGSFEWTSSQVIGSSSKGYQGQIYVLVDYMTMSQAEYTVMALQQHPNTIVIGGQTAGADGNISEIPLPFGIRSVFSGLGVFYPDGRPTQQVGVHRDIEVIQDKSYLDQHRDLQMEKVMEIIRR